MRPAYEPGYEAQCAQDGPYADDEVTEEVENFEAIVAAMHRDGTVDDVAADGGEGESMSDAQEQQDAQEASQSIKRIDEWIAGASLTELRRAYFGIEREVDRRKAENAQEAKELSAFEKPLRKTRSDAGRPRAPREATVGGEELTARAERRAAS